MLNCSDANSLFELGFGASAGIALLNERVRNARAQFFGRYGDALIQHRPDFDRTSLEEPYVHALILAGLPRFRMLLELSKVIQAAAGLAVVIALGTLLQVAHWGTTCKIESIDLVAYCGFAFVFLPVVYIFYPWIVEHATSAAIEKTIHQTVPLVAEILSDRKSRKHFSKLLATETDLIVQLAEADRTGRSKDELKTRLAEIQLELESIMANVKTSSSSVMAEFQKAMRREA